MEYRFYELTGDLEETLHFNHFSKPDSGFASPNLHIRLGEAVEEETTEDKTNHMRVVLRDEEV